MKLKEIAQLAGVSPAAVSRYLNNGPLSEEKKERIQAVIEETGYRPNQTAQTLRTGKVNQIGVIVPKVNSTAVSQVTAGIFHVLSEKGYMTMVGCTNRKDELEIDYLDMMQANHVAGIILMGSRMTPKKAQAFKECNVPLVITGQNFTGYPCVYHDDYNAIKELTTLLIKKGRKKIVYLGVPEWDVATGFTRRRGIVDALEEAGLNGSKMPYIIGDYTMVSGAACMEQLLKEHPDLDGVICATDTIAHGAMLALKNAGRRIPEEVSIAGVGNSHANEIASPRLTTACLYHEECGKEAAKILLQMIEEGNALSKQITLGYSIMDRESV